MRREIKPETLLSHLPLLKGLDAQTLARLAASTRRVRLKRNAVLFREGDLPAGFYAVVYGQIKLAKSNAGGAERTVDIIGPGKSFAEPMMFLGKPYIVSAVALADTLVLQVDARAVFDEIERHPGFARRVISGLARRVEVLVRELDTYALGSAAQRLVHYLLRKVPANASGEVEIALPAAKSAIASKLNLSAEHLSRILHELSSRGLVRVERRRMRIPDLGRLRAYRETGGSRKFRS